MPPKGSKINQPFKREPSVEHTPEYDAFIEELAKYHEKRGTMFEATPKVGLRHLDLHKLYERVVAEGGYDLVSDTKAKPLMWRKVAEEFLGKSPHLAAQAFMVKSAYYKNLVAYEISTHWKKEPPPKEILEEVTAKGGNVMGRTLESYQRPHTREEENLANGDSSDDENGEGTPKQEKVEVDDLPGSATGRSSRGLRQAPPQRVLFNPDTQPARQARNNSNSNHNHVPSPSPATAMANGLNHASYPPHNPSTTLANYEPRQQYPLSLKPVTTPANNPEHYRLKRKQQQDAAASKVAKKYKGLMLPGTGFIGPNIYVRAQLALQSGIPEEEQYALHHLVKISHERGDKYRFDQFAGLAEALVAKVLQISSLFYDVDWSISYEDDDAIPGQSTYLDGVHGTADVLKKLKSRVPLDTDDHVHTAQFSLELGRIAEAALVIRNMVMLEENAQYLSRLPLIRDYVCIVLNLRPHPAVVELQNYALDTAEQLTKYFDLDSKDVLYRSLLSQLETSDRGKIVTSLKAIARIGMLFPTNKRLEQVPLSVLERLFGWMMVEDEELRTACLDFLFQYTSIADNVETLVLDTDVEGLVRQLSSLLFFQAKTDPPRPQPQLPQEKEEPPTQVPRLAPELVQQLLRFSEPERSSHWLRMCFQDDPNSEMTQIHLWQSYQGTFLPYAQTHPHLIAGDFIKNVSNTFSGASAQVAGSNKYVIRGIKPRAIPVDYKGRELVRCQWRSHNSDIVRDYGAIFSYSDGKGCGGWFGNSAAVLAHIISTHLNVPRKSISPMDQADPSLSRPSSSGTPGLTSGFDFARAAAAATQSATLTSQCEWATCTHVIPAQQAFSSSSSAALGLALLARHVETHLPDSAAWKKRHNTSLADGVAPKPLVPSASHVWQRTLMDERNDAAGVPLGCALVLRNIARAIPKIAPAAASTSTKSTGGATSSSAATNGHLHLGTRQDDNDEDDEDDADLSEDERERRRQAKAEAAAYEAYEAETEREETGPRSLMRKVFAPVCKDRLFHAMAHNIVLKDYVGIVLRLIAQGGG
ncbi:hypothetical protein AAFC00_004215 [Neodothiora populina]|uniref:Rsc complex subunit rsc9 n=1 Tax=Neodothiora populina TaxID=2781224 RepID=A0ABR3PJ74_9PEZI